MRNMRTISLVLLTAGCNPGSFQDYLDSAPIRVTSAPERFDSTSYGETMVALNGQLDGQDVGRVVVSGGGGTPLAFVRTYTGGKVSESTFLRCKNEQECTGALDIGAVLIPFEKFGTGTDDARQLCVFAPANASVPNVEKDPRLGGNGYVACEAPSNRPQAFTLGPQMLDVRGDEGTLHYSGFGLPSGHPLGLVMLGVHSTDNRTSAPRNGGLYVLPDLEFSANQRMNIVPYLGLVPLIDPSTGKAFHEAADVGDFGAHVVGAADGKDLTFAIAQPSKQRVIVGRYEDAAAVDTLAKFRVHACITGTQASQLAMGDLTGDAVPELVVASEGAVAVYDGRSLPPAATGESCPPWNAPPTKLPCSEGKGVGCGGFGASLAIGDVDADGTGDLIIGSPLAEVDGKPEVGAVWIVPGSAQGPDDARAVAIAVPREAKAHFGWNVAALRTRGRDEPVASAPGVSQVFTLMCTPLERGFGGSDLCLD